MGPTTIYEQNDNVVGSGIAYNVDDVNLPSGKPSNVFVGGVYLQPADDHTYNRRVFGTFTHTPGTVARSRACLLSGWISLFSPRT